MEIPVTKSKLLEDGLHKGKIVAVNFREEPHQYTDLTIEMADKYQKRVGYPTVISEESGLGRLLQRFGITLAPGSSIEPDKLLVGKECQFQTVTEKKGDKTFSNIVRESVKPIA